MNKEQMSREQASQQMMDHLFFLHKALHREAHKLAEDSLASGVTVPQRIILGMLIRKGNLTIKELSEKIGLSHSTVSGIIDRLERKGFVERFQDPTDRRFTRIMVSSEVKNFVQNRKQHYLFAGILDAFKNATTEEQMKILEGLATLQNLLDP